MSNQNVREQQLQHAFARLDQINPTGLSRPRLAALAGTTEALVKCWQTARDIAPLKGPKALAKTLIGLRKRKRRLERELASVEREIRERASV
jgi:hypothetical protein